MKLKDKVWLQCVYITIVINCFLRISYWICAFRDLLAWSFVFWVLVPQCRLVSGIDLCSGLIPGQQWLQKIRFCFHLSTVDCWMLTMRPCTFAYATRWFWGHFKMQPHQFLFHRIWPECDVEDTIQDFVLAIWDVKVSVFFDVNMEKCKMEPRERMLIAFQVGKLLQ